MMANLEVADMSVKDHLPSDVEIVYENLTHTEIAQIFVNKESFLTGIINIHLNVGDLKITEQPTAADGMVDITDIVNAMLVKLNLPKTKLYVSTNRYTERLAYEILEQTLYYPYIYVSYVELLKLNVNKKYLVYATEV